MFINMAHNNSKAFPTSGNSSDMVYNSTELAWKIHWIVFAVLFWFTGCLSSVLLFKAVRRAPELTRSYRLSVFAMVLTLCLSRFIYLLLNPYEVNEALADNTPVIIIRLLYALGQPSLTAGFGFIHASFLKVAKIRNYHHEPLLKTRTILIIVGLYFTFGVLSEVVVVLLPGMHRMLVVSTSVAVVGCIIVTSTVTYSGLRILNTATQNRRFLSKSLSADSMTASRDQVVKAKSIAKVSRVTLAAATFCIGLTVANSIAFVKMFDTMSSIAHWNSDWQFVTFVSCVRLLEIAMALTLIYALCQTNMKLRKMLGLYRISRRIRMAYPRKSKSAGNPGDAGKGAAWTSTSSVSSVKKIIQ